MRVFFYTPDNPATHKELGRKLAELPKTRKNSQDMDVPIHYRIEVYEKKAIRSLKANAYYHVILNIIAIDTGHTHEQLHEICKKKFNGDIIHLPKGGMEQVGKTTTNMDTAEFTGYVNRVKQWAQDEFGITIPEPSRLDERTIAEIQNTYEENNSGN